MAQVKSIHCCICNVKVESYEAMKIHKCQPIKQSNEKRTIVRCDLCNTRVGSYATLEFHICPSVRELDEQRMMRENRRNRNARVQRPFVMEQPPNA